MSTLSGRLGVALALTLAWAVLCPGTRAAHAQAAAPITYWTPGWPLGFGGNPGVDSSSNTYGRFPSFDGSGARGRGFTHTRYNFPNGWFVGSEAGGMGLGMSGINQYGAFGNFRSLYSEGVQFGYNFEGAGSLPITVYAGFNTLKYNPGIGDPFASLDSRSGTLPGYGYSVNAGVEFQPASNVSVSLGFGYTEQPGHLNGGINSLTSPFGGRR
jgi:opacity protein-like surface antigen